LLYKVLSLLLVLSAFYHEPVNATQPITAKAWIVSDENGKIIEGKNITDVRSIASITKLVTSMVVLDAQQDLNEKMGKLTRKELIQMAMVHSSNSAAVTLCENYPGGTPACIYNMNLKMRMHGLEQTRFVEPTGLSVMNISTAEELIKIVMMAKDYPEIVESSNMPSVKIQTTKNKFLTYNNTNPLVHQYEFIVSKTGFITASGGCIAMMLTNGISQRIVILLGSQNTKTRIPEALKLFKLHS